MTAPTIHTSVTAHGAQFLAPLNNQGADVQETHCATEGMAPVRRLRAVPTARLVDVSELVIEARCAMALARVLGPLDFRRAFEHCRAARRWAYRAGAASSAAAGLPLQFEGSPTLTGAWHTGRCSRPRAAASNASGAFRVEAGTTDPCDHDRSSRPLVVSHLTARRADAIQRTRFYWQRGYWVEVFNDTTGELLAGPFDPDQGLPRFIV